MKRKTKAKKRFELFKHGKLLFSSLRKLDTIFEHNKYKRRDKVTYRETG